MLENETKIMEILHHPNIVKYHEQWEGSNTLNYVLELIEGEDLYNYVISKGCLNE